MNQEQFKIDGMSETEVLRIEGNVTVPKGTELSLEVGFKSLIECCEGAWQGTISPLNPDAESFMVEVPKHQFKEMQKLLEDYKVIIQNQHGAIEANNKAFSDLAEQLRQEKEQLKVHKEVNEIRKKTIAIQRNSIEKAEQIIQALELRLKVKDSPIKAGLKRIWKWFKGLVGK